MDFLGIAGFLWELLILTLLPLVSIIMGMLFLFKIFKAAQLTTGKWFGSMGKRSRR